MEQKRVSFKVAKAIKEAGYPQNRNKIFYVERDYNSFRKGTLYEACNIEISDNIPFISAPTYFDVQLWLWREKKWFIKIQPLKDKFHYQILDHHYDEWHSWGVLSMAGYLDPEEAIIAAIEYLVDNDLIK